MIYQDDSKLFIGNGPPWFRNSVFGLALHHFRTNYYGWGYAACAFIALIFGALWSQHWQYAIAYACAFGSESLAKSMHWAAKTHEEFNGVRFPVRGSSSRLQIVAFILIWTQIGSLPLLTLPEADSLTSYLLVSAGLALSFRIGLQIGLSALLFPWLVIISGQLDAHLPSVVWVWILVAFAILSYLISTHTWQSWAVNTEKLIRVTSFKRRTLNHFLNIRPILNIVVLSALALSIILIALEYSFWKENMPRKLLWTGSTYLVLFATLLSLVKATQWLMRFKEHALLKTVPSMSVIKLQSALWRDVAVFIIAVPGAVMLPRIVEWRIHPNAFISSEARYLVTSLGCVLDVSLIVLWGLMAQLRTEMTYYGVTFAGLMFMSIFFVGVTSDDPNSSYVLTSLLIALVYLNYRERRLWLGAPERLLSARVLD